MNCLQLWLEVKIIQAVLALAKFLKLFFWLKPTALLAFYPQAKEAVAIQDIPPISLLDIKLGAQTG